MKNKILTIPEIEQMTKILEEKGENKKYKNSLLWFFKLTEGSYENPYKFLKSHAKLLKENPTVSEKIFKALKKRFGDEFHPVGDKMIAIETLKGSKEFKPVKKEYINYISKYTMEQLVEMKYYTCTEITDDIVKRIRKFATENTIPEVSYLVQMMKELVVHNKENEVFKDVELKDEKGVQI